MRIGIDARMYGRRTGGIGRYIKELVSRLELLDNKNEYVIFLSKETFLEYNPSNKNFKKVLAPWRWYSFGEQIFFPFLLYRYNFDVVHFPHFNVPIFYFKRFIVTIHDLILLRDTQERATTLGPIFYSIKKFLYKLIIKRACYKSYRIITLTNFGKKDLLSFFKVNSDKVVVIYHGVSSLDDKQMDTNREFLYNDHVPYVLYVGNAYPHKNLSVLIHAMDSVNSVSKMKLLLVGEMDFFYKRLQKEYPRSYMSVIGGVSDTKLSELYKNAFCFVLASRYEGFGFPPIEAMRYGCPVVSSNASCLPEVLGDSALYFQASDHATLSLRILEISNDSSLRRRLINAGREHVNIYSWDLCVRETQKLYEQKND